MLLVEFENIYIQLSCCSFSTMLQPLLDDSENENRVIMRPVINWFYFFFISKNHAQSRSVIVHRFLLLALLGVFKEEKGGAACFSSEQLDETELSVTQATELDYNSIIGILPQPGRLHL